MDNQSEATLYKTGSYHFQNGVIEGGYVVGMEPEVAWLHVDVEGNEPFVLFLNKTEVLAILDILTSGLIQYHIREIHGHGGVTESVSLS
jgi:hypothetical protein